MMSKSHLHSWPAGLLALALAACCGTAVANGRPAPNR